jgi:hypothetical protein
VELAHHKEGTTAPAKISWPRRHPSANEKPPAALRHHNLVALRHNLVALRHNLVALHHNLLVALRHSHNLLAQSGSKFYDGTHKASTSESTENWSAFYCQPRDSSSLQTLAVDESTSLAILDQAYAKGSTTAGPFFLRFKRTIRKRSVSWQKSSR